MYEDQGQAIALCHIGQYSKYWKFVLTQSPASCLHHFLLHLLMLEFSILSKDLNMVSFFGQP